MRKGSKNKILRGRCFEMKKVVLKFLKTVKKEYPELLIEGRISGEETEIFYYGEESLLLDKNFQNKMGECIENIFEKKNFYDFYFRNVSEQKFWEIREKAIKKMPQQKSENTGITAVPT